MSQKSVNITFLGTGCDYGSKEREPTCVFIERGYDKILLECCPAILRRLWEINKEPPEIGTVFLSHLHPGHFMGLPSFTFGNLPKGRESTLKIIAPENKKERILQTLKWSSEGIADKGMMEIPTSPFSIQIDEASANDFEEFKLRDDITLTTAPLKHGCDCLGCSIEFETQKMKIAYSGDTMQVENMAKLAQNATLLIHEAFFEHVAVEWAHARWHSTVREAAEIAEKANVEVLALVHSHWSRYNKPNIKEKYLSEAEEIFGGEVLMPSDLDEIDLLSYCKKPIEIEG